MKKFLFAIIAVVTITGNAQEVKTDLKAEAKRLYKIKKQLKKYGPDQVEYKKEYTAKAKPLAAQINKLTKQIASKEKTVNKLEKKYNDLMTKGVRKRWRTADRIGWHYKDEPNTKNPISSLKDRDRKRGIVYLYPDRKELGKKEAEKLKPTLNNEKAALASLKSQQNNLLKKYQVIWNQAYKDICKEYKEVKDQLKAEKSQS